MGPNKNTGKDPNGGITYIFAFLEVISIPLTFIMNYLFDFNHKTITTALIIYGIGLLIVIICAILKKVYIAAIVFVLSWVAVIAVLINAYYTNPGKSSPESDTSLTTQNTESTNTQENHNSSVPIEDIETESPSENATQTIETTEQYVKNLEIAVGIGECRLDVGQELLISHSIYPSSASNYALNWVSSNPDCVSVDDSGRIRASSVGVATISVEFANFPDLGAKTVHVFVSDPNASTNSNLHIEYHEIAQNEHSEKWYVFFDIDNPNDLTITETRVEAYDDEGVMTYSEILPNPTPRRTNFAGYFTLNSGQLYIFRGYVITSDGTEHKSEAVLVRIE